MCRLFAYLGGIRDLSPYLWEGERSLRALSAKHSDGWGIARWSGGRPAVVKSAARADGDKLYEEQARWTRSTAVLAHVRAASDGLAVTLENAHPFAHGPWAFAHNGTIRGLDAAAHARLVAELPEDLRARVRGTTDSEIAFSLVVKEILARYKTLAVPAEVAAEALLDVQARLVKEFPGSEKRSETNFALGNGLGFAITRNGKSLYALQGDGFACVASEPLGPEPETWKEVPDRSLVLMKDGGAVEVRPLQ